MVKITGHFVTYPQICVFEIGPIVFDDVGRVTLLHDGNLLDDLLQILVHRDLLDGQDLAGFLVQGLEHGSITSLAQFTENVKHLLRLASQRLFGEFLQLPEKETNPENKICCTK